MQGYGTEEPLRQYLVADAIYVSRHQISSDLDRDLRQKPQELESRGAYPLSQAATFMSDQALADHLAQNVMDLDDSQDRYWHGKPWFDREEAKLRIFRRHRQIAATGEGEQVVDLVVTDTETLMTRSPAIVRHALGSLSHLGQKQLRQMVRALAAQAVPSPPSR